MNSYPPRPIALRNSKTIENMLSKEKEYRCAESSIVTLPIRVANYELVSDIT